MKSGFLRDVGVAPTWDPLGVRHGAVDGQIEQARSSDFPAQKQLYRNLALHLHRNRFAENAMPEDDHSEDVEWLRRLAIYFGWSDEAWRRVDVEAVRDAYKQ